MAVLTVGSKGTEVELLQYLLGVIVDGSFGNKTMEALKSFCIQRKVELVNNGIDFSFVSKWLEETELLNVKEAKKYIGIKEDDIDGDGKGDNRGKEIDRMIAVCFPKFNFADKKAKGFAWCACFLSYIFLNSYSSLNFKSASAREWLKFFKDRATGDRITSNRQLRWDCVYVGGWVNPDGTGHIYIVDPIESLKLEDNSSVATIEGNTDTGGTREGDGIYRRVRNLTKNEVYGIKIR